MITCYLQYQIDPYKREEFRKHAEMWLHLVPKFGGTHRGYFLPKESASDLAVALFSFASLADYETYRLESQIDPDCRAASAFANETRCIIRLDRQFLEPVGALE
jgi:hypothetical protein